MESRHSASIYLCLDLRQFQHLLWKSWLGGRIVILQVSKCSLLAPPEGTTPCFACVANLPNHEDYLSRVRPLVCSFVFRNSFLAT